METEQVVVFKLMEQEFGIDINQILEIQNYEPIRPIPNVPAYVEGIINVRGSIYSIFNLRARLNMPAKEDKTAAKIILLSLTEVRAGMLIDNVSEILTVDPEEVECPPNVIENNAPNCISGIIKSKGRMILILNVNSLLSTTDELSLEGVIDEKDCSSNPK